MLAVLVPPTHTQMLCNERALHLPVTVKPVVKLASGGVSVNPSLNKTTIKRSSLYIRRFYKRFDI